VLPRREVFCASSGRSILDVAGAKKMNLISVSGKCKNGMYLQEWRRMYQSMRRSIFHNTHSDFWQLGGARRQFDRILLRACDVYQLLLSAPTQIINIF
jgi:hypothetical protein